METVTSKDGTKIAFDQSGEGPALIIVTGAIQYRAFDEGTAQLEALLAPQFTVIHYDRRGRGDSGDTLPFAVQREIEDIEALIDHAGGSALVYGMSSGAALAMEATIALGPKIAKLAMYEAPYNSDESVRHGWIEYRKQLTETLAAGQRGDAIVLFMRLVGMPADQAQGMSQSPIWPMFEAVAPTLAYDAAALGDEADVPVEHAAQVTVPTLVMDGGASFPFMRVTATALAEAMPHGQHRTLEGQTHQVDSAALAPVLREFFLDSPSA